MFPFFSFLFFFFPLLNSILLHVFVFQRIIYILIKDGSPSLSQAKKLKYFLRNEAICLLICCLFFVQYSLSSIAFREATVIVCNYARYVLLKKKTNGLKASWKLHTLAFFVLFFLKAVYDISLCTDVPLPFEGRELDYSIWVLYPWSYGKDIYLPVAKCSSEKLYL